MQIDLTNLLAALSPATVKAIHDELVTRCIEEPDGEAYKHNFAMLVCVSNDLNEKGV